MWPKGHDSNIAGSQFDPADPCRRRALERIHQCARKHRMPAVWRSMQLYNVADLTRPGLPYRLVKLLRFSIERALTYISLHRLKSY